MCLALEARITLTSMRNITAKCPKKRWSTLLRAASKTSRTTWANSMASRLSTRVSRFSSQNRMSFLTMKGRSSSFKFCNRCSVTQIKLAPSLISAPPIWLCKIWMWAYEKNDKGSAKQLHSIDPKSQKQHNLTQALIQDILIRIRRQHSISLILKERV